MKTALWAHDFVIKVTFVHYPSQHGNDLAMTKYTGRQLLGYGRFTAGIMSTSRATGTATFELIQTVVVWRGTRIYVEHLQSSQIQTFFPVRFRYGHFNRPS